MTERKVMENIICLTDEHGEEVEFEFLDLVEYKGEEYVILIPAEDSDGEVLILRIEELNEEEESYCSVEDETVLQAVFDLFKEKFTMFNEEEKELMNVFGDLFEEEES